MNPWTVLYGARSKCLYCEIIMISLGTRNRVIFTHWFPHFSYYCFSRACHFVGETLLALRLLGLLTQWKENFQALCSRKRRNMVANATNEMISCYFFQDCKGTNYHMIHQAFPLDVELFFYIVDGTFNNLLVVHSVQNKGCVTEQRKYYL